MPIEDGSGGAGSDDDGGELELHVRMKGPLAERFRAFHGDLQLSSDLDHLKLGDMSASALVRYALFEWLKHAEAEVLGGRR